MSRPSPRTPPSPQRPARREHERETMNSFLPCLRASRDGLILRCLGRQFGSDSNKPPEAPLICTPFSGAENPRSCGRAARLQWGDLGTGPARTKPKRANWRQLCSSSPVPFIPALVKLLICPHQGLRPGSPLGLPFQVIRTPPGRAQHSEVGAGRPEVGSRGNSGSRPGQAGLDLKGGMSRRRLLPPTSSRSWLELRT